MGKRKAFSLAAVAALVLAGVAGAYGTGADAGPKPPADALWQPTTHPGAYDPGDLIEVDLDNLQGINAADRFVLRVQTDGTVTMPLAGDVAVAGRTRTEVATAIRDALSRADIVRDASFDIRRLQVAGSAGAVAPGPIGNYDLVRFTLPDFNPGKGGRPPVYVTRIDGSGQTVLPLVGPVKVAGLTDREAAVAIAKVYADDAIAKDAGVSVLTLERAPADAAHKSLPDGPVEPVPEALRPLYAGR